MPGSLRPVGPDDATLLWEWANEAEVRQNSFYARPVTWEDHLRWFQEKLEKPPLAWYLLVVTEPDGLPAGVVRFDEIDGQVIASASVVAAMRGKGYGTMLLQLAMRQIAETTSATAVHAFIKPDNVASLKAFKRAGFAAKGETAERVHLVWER